MSSVSDSGFKGVWRGSCGQARWHPLELLAMVLGFMVFWPIGLGIIAYKMAQRRGLVGGEWFDGLRNMFPGGPQAASTASASRTGWGPFGASPSGNAAFDEWRKAEIERLEVERRKLEEAQREFSAFVEEARRARDREEFERFMARRPPA